MLSGGLQPESTPMRKWLLFIPLSLGALEVDPWLGNLWEFKFTPSYTYSRFRDVQGGDPQLKAASNDHVIAAGLGTSFSPTWAFDVDAEFADTPRQSMGYRSSGYQLRHEWSNDIEGDLATFTTGVNVRGVSRHSLKDVSCPYHSDFNFELTGALGKEWCNGGPEWKVRTYGFATVGMANHGSPWTRFILSIEGNEWDRHRFGLFLLGYFGFGPHNRVNTHDFHGYASIHHQSIDAAVRYAYVFDIWGHIDFIYTRRLYAHAFPKNVNFFTISYTLPFSFF